MIRRTYTENSNMYRQLRCRYNTQTYLAFSVMIDLLGEVAEIRNHIAVDRLVGCPAVAALSRCSRPVSSITFGPSVSDRDTSFSCRLPRWTRLDLASRSRSVQQRSNQGHGGGPTQPPSLRYPLSSPPLASSLLVSWVGRVELLRHRCEVHEGAVEDGLTVARNAAPCSPSVHCAPGII